MTGPRLATEDHEQEGLCERSRSYREAYAPVQLPCLLVRSFPCYPSILRSCFLGYRVSAMIVSFDRVNQRAKVLDKMIIIAKALRQLNNYMGMNAFVAGINNVRGQDDEELTQVMASRPNSNWKQFKSLQVLVGNARSGQVYRTALKHTPGAAIPDLCVPFVLFSVFKVK